MVSINSFLKANNKTIFIEKETGLEFSKDEIDINFQFEQDCGRTTILEYIETLTNYLNQFKITSLNKGNAK